MTVDDLLNTPFPITNVLKGEELPTHDGEIPVPSRGEGRLVKWRNLIQQRIDQIRAERERFMDG